MRSGFGGSLSFGSSAAGSTGGTEAGTRTGLGGAKPSFGSGLGGAKPSFGSGLGSTPSFGSGLGSTPSFGSGLGSTPSFGSGLGSTPSFGSGLGSTPSFGSGLGSTPSFGSGLGSTPSFGSGLGSTPSFGSGLGSTPSFGSALGSTPSFGSGLGSTPSFGSGLGSTPSFGSSSNKPGFGVRAATPSFGTVGEKLGGGHNSFGGTLSTTTSPPAFKATPTKVNPFSVKSQGQAADTMRAHRLVDKTPTPPSSDESGSDDEGILLGTSSGRMGASPSTTMPTLALQQAQSAAAVGGGALQVDRRADSTRQQTEEDLGRAFDPTEAVGGDYDIGSETDDQYEVEHRERQDKIVSVCNEFGYTSDEAETFLERHEWDLDHTIEALWADNPSEGTKYHNHDEDAATAAPSRIVATNAVAPSSSSAAGSAGSAAGGGMAFSGSFGTKAGSQGGLSS
eukprot:SAG31_NODE_7338_length_1715_cov_4.717822_2_plen_449_part_01